MTDRIAACLRIRPATADAPPCVVALDNKLVAAGSKRTFSFDRVFPPQATTEDVFDDGIRELITGFRAGYNTTVMAYGQTGTGKTFTISGIVELALHAILQTESIDDLSFSFIELYNDSIFDLLPSAGGSAKPLQLFDGNGTDGTQIIGANRVKIRTKDQAMFLVNHGERNRRTASTSMNRDSSRSHSLFTVFNSKTMSKMTFVDLAGSERNKKTKNVGTRFKESVTINTGLLALGSVIRALSQTPPSAHVPYRSSKLTRLLQDSLGGNSKTLFIACVSSDTSNMDESVRTLQYAAKAMKILNEPLPQLDEVAAASQHQDPAQNEGNSREERAAEIEAFKSTIVELQRELKEARITVRKDEIIFAENLRTLKQVQRENSLLKDEVVSLRQQLAKQAVTPQRKIGSPQSYVPSNDVSPQSNDDQVHYQTQDLAHRLDDGDSVRNGSETPPRSPSKPKETVSPEAYRVVLTDNLFFQNCNVELKQRVEELTTRNTELAATNQSLLDELEKINALLS